MPDIDDMLPPSKYLKQSDVGVRGVLATVAGVQFVNISTDPQNPDEKWIMHFHELEKPLVLNPTNIHLCAQIFQERNYDNWTGKQIVLFADPNVSYKGKLTGGVRVRASLRPPAPVPAQQGVTNAPQPGPVNAPHPGPNPGDFDDDIPF